MSGKQKTISDKMKTKIAKEIFALKMERPNLAIIIVGADHVYFEKIKNLEKEAKSVGIDTNLYICDSVNTENELEDIIKILNNDEMIDAIYIQPPLPNNFNFDDIVLKVKPIKDVSIEENFEKVDWQSLEAKIFNATLQAYKERINEK